MVHYFYHLDYDTSPRGDQGGDGNETSETPDAPQAPCLLTHAKVYSIGEKYLISGLKSLALEKFEAAAKEHWGRTDFLNAVREAYSSTLETDRGLKNAVIAALYKHSDLLDQEEGQQVFQELHMLAYDVLMYVHTEKLRF